MTGYIYAIESGGNIKLGFSKSPASRVSKIASDNCHPVKMLGYWPASADDEADLHSRFSKYRSHREWFHDVDEIREYVRARTTSDSFKGFYRKRKTRALDIFFEALGGRKIICDLLNVQNSALSNYIARGSLPLWTRDILQELCEQLEIGCPRELFAQAQKPGRRSENDSREAQTEETKTEVSAA